MITCPNCGEAFRKFETKKVCPLCLEELIKYEGKWYKESDGTPPTIILKAFSREVSKKLSTSTRRVVWDIPPKSERQRREIGLAKKLFEKCNNDLDYVLEVLQEAFYNQKFAWKNRESLTSVLSDFSFLDAIIKGRKQEEEQHKLKEIDAFDKVMQREDLFS